MTGDWERAPLFRRNTQRILGTLLAVFWRLEVSGLENVPDGAAILAANHNALIDGPLLGVATGLVRRYFLPLTKQEAYRIPVVGWFLRGVGTIPLERKGDVQAMRAALDWLAQAGGLIIFPEGTRSRTGVPLRPKAGVGFLASRSGAPVIPARIYGTRRFPFARIKVRIGPPLPPPPPDADRAACLAFAESVMAAILSL